MILEPPQKKSDTVSTVSPSVSHGVMGSDAIVSEIYVALFMLSLVFSILAYLPYLSFFLSMFFFFYYTLPL